MTKVEAIDVLMHVSRMEKQPAWTTFRRALKALQVLNLTPDEQLEAMQHLDMVGTNRKPFGKWYTGQAVLPWSVEGGK